MIMLGRPALNSDLYSDERKPALIKHELLNRYLLDLALHLGSWAESLLFVDGFAGPWKCTGPALEDSSFAIAVSNMAKAQAILRDKWGRDLAMHAILIERSREAFDILQDFSQKNDGKPVQITAKQGEFENHIDLISEKVRCLGNKCFLFLLLDPKGWSGLSMTKVKPLVSRTSEILVNVMVRDLRRFLEQEDRAESYKEFFGREGVREAVLASEQDERPDALIRDYCKSLKEVCGIRYVSSCIVLNSARNEPRYFMVFGTNHHRGIEVFKDAETHAAGVQKEVVSQLKKQAREANGALELMLDDEHAYFRNLRQKYTKRALEHADSRLKLEGSLLFRDYFCEAAAFPLVTRKTVLSHVLGNSQIHVDLELSPQKKRKVPDCNRGDRVVWVG